jgi:hypothetical protein
MLAFWITTNKVVRKEIRHHALVFPMQNKPGVYVSGVLKFTFLDNNSKGSPIHGFKMYAKEQRACHKIFLNIFPTYAEETPEDDRQHIMLQLIKILKDEFDFSGNCHMDAEGHKIQLLLDDASMCTCSALHVRFGRLFYRILTYKTFGTFYFEDLY